MVHLAFSLRSFWRILGFLLLGSIHTLPFGAVNCWFLISIHLIMSSWFELPIAGNCLPMLLPTVQILHLPYSIMLHTCQSAQIFRDCSSGSQSSTQVGCSTECNIYNTLQLPYDIKNRRSTSVWLSGLRIPTASILRTGSPNIDRSSCCATTRSFAVRSTHPLVSSPISRPRSHLQSQRADDLY
jgi:hypothetical protein